MLTKLRKMEQQDRFITPLLEKPLEYLSRGFNDYINDKKEQENLNILLQDFCGRETPLFEARNLSKRYGGKIFIKREDLVHGGAHKLNNAIAQCSLAKFMGINNIIAETGAGQHGVGTAMAGANLGLSVKVYQGIVDVQRQELNALRMRLFGANLISVSEGKGKLKEAVNAAMRDWVSNYQNHAYCIGSIVGPHPFPTMVRHFQKVIGDETKVQILEKTGKLPSAILACAGGGSNAAGMFTAFANHLDVAFIACEASGAAKLSKGTMGILHGMESLVLQTQERQIAETHSISAGLDYPAIGPWLCGLKQENRLHDFSITDDECVEALKLLAKEEGILCALESAHAVAGAKKYLAKNPDKTIIICLSGRGDKDLDLIKKYMNLSENKL
jgi:tryptophan synthase beta chain